MSSIYKIINHKTGKCYVGQTKRLLDVRFKAHCNLAKQKPNIYLYNAINYYGPENFDIYLIEEVPVECANDRERFWIKELDTLAPNGYNMTEGGDHTYSLSLWSEEDRKKLWKKQGESRKGHVVLPETISKLIAAHKGIPMSQEQKEKIRDTMISRGIKPLVPYSKKGNEHWAYGKKKSEETVFKLRKARIGKSWDELYGNDVATRLRKELSDRTKGKSITLHIPYVKSLAFCDPDLASEWAFHKNTDVTPFNVAYHSGKKVWWICNNGHEYMSTINNRSHGRGCNACFMLNRAENGTFRSI